MGHGRSPEAVEERIEGKTPMHHNRKFKVIVNGKKYDVEVEEIQDNSQGPIGVAPANRPVAIPAAVPVAAAAPVAASAGVVASPMAGKVLKVCVKEGDQIKAGQLVIVLEAMKMETNVNASADGEVKEVLVAEGAAVEAGAALIRCE